MVDGSEEEVGLVSSHFAAIKSNYFVDKAETGGDGTSRPCNWMSAAAPAPVGKIEQKTLG